MTGETLETRVCVLKKSVGTLKWLFVLLTCIWGLDLGYTAIANNGHGMEDARQGEQIKHLEEAVKDQKEVNCEILKKLDSIGKGISSIETKIKIYHGERD